ncbi:ABC transporter permease [Elusimicrobiota bacterium]
MRKTLMVVRREYLERVRTKAFWLGIILPPALMMGMMYAAHSLVDMEATKQKKIAVVDATGKLLEPMREAMAESKLKSGSPRYLLEAAPEGDPLRARKSLEPLVASGKYLGILVIDDRDGRAKPRFYAKNLSDFSSIIALKEALRDAVIGLRLERSKLPVKKAALDLLLAPVDMETFQISKSGEAKKKGLTQAYYGVFIFVFILYMSIVMYGGAVMRGIIEEKSSRIMEVLLGSLTSEQLMSGKILGIGLVGLTQIAVYALTAGMLRLYVAASGIDASWVGMLDTFSILNMFYFVFFFLLGYFIYTSMFAVAGAVSNTEQDAQHLQTPMILALAVPMATTFYFVANPDSIAAVVLSLIPFFAPVVMFMRVSVMPPPAWQVALSIGLMLAAIVLLLKGAARVFRVGILMYGKRPTLPEIFRWVRD